MAPGLAAPGAAPAPLRCPRSHANILAAATAPFSPATTVCGGLFDLEMDGSCHRGAAGTGVFVAGAAGFSGAAGGAPGCGCLERTWSGVGLAADGAAAGSGVNGSSAAARLQRLLMESCARSPFACKVRVIGRGRHLNGCPRLHFWLCRFAPLPLSCAPPAHNNNTLIRH